MVMKEVKMDLLSVPQGYYLAHCITADFSLGAGVAKRIDEEYNMIRKLKIWEEDLLWSESKAQLVGTAILIDNVYNLVIKKYPDKKAKYKKLYYALESMSSQMYENNTKKLAIPKLGCGHEGLEWEKVRHMIQDVFKYMDVEILVCSI